MTNGGLDTSDKLAIIGMVGRFPGADSVEAFWENLKNGVNAVSSFTEEELLESGVAKETFNKETYVNAKGFIDKVDLFDAGFFEMTPKEAAMLDPQHRVFLECAWEALEQAGYNSDRFQGRIGVYSSVDANTYLINNLLANKKALHSMGEVEHLLSDKDYISTRVSYKLNLRGSSYTVQCACSSSLVALHLAAESLLNGENDMALAGGISISFPLKAGYFHEEGGIVSKDGKCKAFDKDADGTIYGNGVGLVVLKRLEDALEDKDTIHAVVLGTAVNNDGAVKVGYTAPSIEGQAAAISEAMKMAQVPAQSIGYIETHGTGTKLGDTIEMAALNKAYSQLTHEKGYCAIGSVKTNIGHLSTAAGVASLIKTVLAIKHGEIPPSLHYQAPNPTIDFTNSPFYVNSQLQPWKVQQGPRRAGVSSFGLGGTNVHVILEEAPKDSRPEKEEQEDNKLILLSAKTEQALEVMENNLQHYLKQHVVSFADLAYTLQVGRKEFPFRKSYVARDNEQLIHLLEKKEAFYSNINDERKPLVFMFSGFNEQYKGMTTSIYQKNKVYQEALDKALGLLQSKRKLNYKHVLFYGEEEDLLKPSMAYPLIFSVEYALAQVLMAVNIKPSAMIGHSIGEYVAACLSGVISLEDSLELLCIRGELIESLPQGAMLTVMLSEEELKPYLTEGLSLAAVNSPTICGVSGNIKAIEELKKRLLDEAIACISVDTDYAFHSFMMEDIEDKFLEALNQVTFKEPEIPYISNVTGEWITSDVTNPTYWVQHLKQGVMFYKGLKTLCEDKSMLLVEVGPGRVLGSFTLQSASTMKAVQTVIQTLPTKKAFLKEGEDDTYLLKAIGQLWCLGINIDWNQLNDGKVYGRIPLPTYPFQRRRYYIAPALSEESTLNNKDERSILYESWRQTLLPINQHGLAWVVIADEEKPFVQDFIKTVEANNKKVIPVYNWDKPVIQEGCRFKMGLDDVEAYIYVFQALMNQKIEIDHIVYLAEGKYMLSLLKALDLVGRDTTLHLTVVTCNAYSIIGNETIEPLGFIMGLEEVIASQFQKITYRLIDTEPRCDSQHLINAISAEVENKVIGIRNRGYWLKEMTELNIANRPPEGIRKQGTYLLISGMQASAYLLAQELIKRYECHLIFMEDKEAMISDEMTSKISQLEGEGVIEIIEVDWGNKEEIQRIRETTEELRPIQGVFHFLEAPLRTTGLQQINDKDLVDQWLVSYHQLALIEEVFHQDTTDFLLTMIPLPDVVGIEYTSWQSHIKHYIDSLKSNKWYVAKWFNPHGQYPQDRLGASMAYEVVGEVITYVMDYPNDPLYILSPMDPVIMRERMQHQEEELQLAIEDERPLLPTNYIEPRNEWDREIVAIWKHILGFSQIGIEDNFFELGGNSLLALQILFRMNQQFQVEVPMAEFISDPTIKFLSNYVTSIHWIKQNKEEDSYEQPLKSFSL